MQKNIKVESCTIKKEGTNEKTGKDWVLYNVVCSGDDDMKSFSTFNGDYINSECQQMRGNFEYDSKWKNWKEISVAQEKENSKHDEIMNALKEIWSKIDDLEKGGWTKKEMKDIEKNGFNGEVPPEEHLREGELEIPIIDEK